MKEGKREEKKKNRKYFWIFTDRRTKLEGSSPVKSVQKSKHLRCRSGSGVWSVAVPQLPPWHVWVLTVGQAGGHTSQLVTMSASHGRHNFVVPFWKSENKKPKTQKGEVHELSP